MKRMVLFFLCVISPSAFADTIHITVNGMVCSFCAQGVEKQLKTLSGVSNVNVDLDSKVVEVKIADEQKVTDDRLKEKIQNAGFSVVSIHRMKE